MKKIIIVVFSFFCTSQALALPPFLGSMTYPGAGVAVSNGTGWTTSLDAAALSSISGLTEVANSLVTTSAADTYTITTPPTAVWTFITTGDMSGLSFVLNNGTSTPATCTEGELFYETDANLLWSCSATNTWSAMVGEGVASGGIIFGDTTPDTAGEIGYASTQLSIHDGTASRDLLQVASTTITKTEFLPIRYAEDGTTAPAAAAEIGTSAVVGRSFVEDADNDVWFNWLVPLDYSAGIKYRVIYAIQTDADADETVAFSLAGCSVGDLDALACSVGTPVVVTDELGVDYDANETIITEWSTAVTVTNIVAGEFARLHFLRDVSEDDYAGADDNTFVIGIEIKYQAKVNASGDY